MSVTLHFFGEGFGKTAFLDTYGSPVGDFMLLITRGCFSVRFPRLDKECTVRENEGIFIASGEPFERHILEPIDYYQFAFSANEEPYYTALHSGKLAISPPHLSALMESFHRAGTLQDGGEMLVHLLKYLFFEQYLFSNAPRTQKIDDDIRSVTAYMEAHLSEKIDVDDLAARVYLSHTGLIWKFKRQVGVSPLQYLIELRMQRAKELLLTGTLSVSEIAERCGYPNAYYFTNAFRKHTGKSPTAFRKSSI